MKNKYVRNKRIKSNKWFPMIRRLKRLISGAMNVLGTVL